VLDRAAVILEERLGPVLPGVSVARAGNEIVVTVPNATADTRDTILAVVDRRSTSTSRLRSMTV
jgi:hypothetical protein